MKFHLPRNECPLTKLTARAGNWSTKRYLGPANREYELMIPQGIDLDEVEVTVEGCDENGKSMEPATILKSATKKPRVSPVEPILIEDSPSKPKAKPERRRAKRREDNTAQEERPSDQPLSAECVVNDDRDAG
jgi:hypothetical protein